jgi:TIR domain
MSGVFISYNRESKKIATTLVADIEALGHVAWFDQEISGGRTWWDQILSKVRECDVFIFILDPQSLASAACKREYGYAADLGKSILPVLVSDQVSPDLLPPALSRIQFVDYRVADREAGFRLARALATISTSPPLPDPLPPPPEAPISYLGSLMERVESSSPLTYEDQSVLVADLRSSLRDVENGDHAQRLLEALRRRRDLYAVFADEIDELLRKVQNPPLTPLPPAQQATPPLQDNPPFEAISSVRDWTISSVKEWTTRNIRSAWRRLLTPETRLGAALRAGIIGYFFSLTVLSILRVVSGYYPDQDLFYSVGMFALIGAIAGKNKLANLAALVVVTIAAVITVATTSSDLFIKGEWAAALVVFIFFVLEKLRANKQ